MNGQKVGWRRWDEQGRLFIECGMKNGLDHGLCRHFNQDGAINYEVNCFRGKVHGVSRQYSRNGKLIGTSRMHHGTGVDLWYDEDGQLSEERHIRDGRWNGFERWWVDEHRVSCERHFQQDIVHGIHREWNANGKLRRGFPRYFVNGSHVTKRQYLRASEKDPLLPEFHEADNKAEREFPKALTSGAS